MPNSLPDYESVVMALEEAPTKVHAGYVARVQLCADALALLRAYRETVESLEFAAANWSRRRGRREVGQELHAALSAARERLGLR